MLYRLARFLLKIGLVALYRPDVRGLENVPQTGPVVLCSNHISWWDPPAVGCTMKRRVYFMAKEELFRGLFGWILLGIGAFPVRRGVPDRKAIRRALHLLESGEVLGLFPEGTRGKGMALGKAEPGVSLLAARSGAPVIPVAIQGPYRLGHRLKVTYGAPIYLDGRNHEENSSRLMEAIRGLLDLNGD